jgi:epidermal growth factor receptor substrate 15
VLFNKCDLPNSVAPSQLDLTFQSSPLAASHAGGFSSMSVSAATGKGVEQLLHWLDQCGRQLCQDPMQEQRQDMEQQREEKQIEYQQQQSASMQQEMVKHEKLQQQEQQQEEQRRPQSASMQEEMVQQQQEQHGESQAQQQHEGGHILTPRQTVGLHLGPCSKMQTAAIGNHLVGEQQQEHKPKSAGNNGQQQQQQHERSQAQQQQSASVQEEMAQQQQQQQHGVSQAQWQQQSGEEGSRHQDQEHDRPWEQHWQLEQVEQGIFTPAKDLALQFEQMPSRIQQHESGQAEATGWKGLQPDMVLVGVSVSGQLEQKVALKQGAWTVSTAVPAVAD